MDRESIVWNTDGVILSEKKNFLWTGKQSRVKEVMIKPDTSKMDYKYGIFAYINREYGTGIKYWTNRQIKAWCNKMNVFYKETDTRAELVERIKQAGYK